MNFIKRSILSILALVVFATSSCFAIDIHMCEGQVQSTALFSKAAPCDQMEEMQKEEVRECCKKIRDAEIASSSSKLLFKKKACCYNTVFEYKLDLNQDAQPTAAVLGSIDVIVPVAFEYSSESFDFETVADKPLRGPPEPFITRDFPALYQVYII